MNIQIRRLTPADAELQKELIYIALWDHPDEPRRPVNVLEHPVVRAYYEDWGREGDIGLLTCSKCVGNSSNRFFEISGSEDSG